MVITTTAVAFILLALGLGFCGFWFFRAFRKNGRNSKIGVLLSTLYFGFSLQNGIVGLGVLLFTNNAEILFYILILSHFLVVAIGVIGIYTSYYVFLSKSSPKFPIVLGILLGIFAITALIADHPQPFLTSERGIDFNFNFITSLTTFYIFFVSIGSNVYIFTRLLFWDQNRQIRILSFILSLTGIFGIINIFIRFVVLYSFSVEARTRIFDIGLEIISAIFIVILFLWPKLRNWIQSRKLTQFRETMNKSL
jgi:hypothetical protein